jgi:hypothetical protein
MESTFHKRALHEYNMSLPAYRPFFRYEQLPAAIQSRIDERARQLAFEALDALYQTLTRRQNDESL